MTGPTAVNLWHGYSLADIDRLARLCASTSRGGNSLDPTDRYQTAWSHIAETLCTADGPPTTASLVYGGCTAINRAGQDYQHTWGKTRVWGSHQGDMRAFARYWELPRRAVASPEESVVDRLALQQIMPRLSVHQQRLLYALAVHDGDVQASADSLGMSLRTYQSALSPARAAFRALWHEGETPSRMWARSGTSGTSAMRALRNRRQKRAYRERSAAA